jgi:hypothetical protein
MIDFVIRYCSYMEWLPIIVETGTGRELYRGDRHRTRQAAFDKAMEVWENDGTGNIVEYKQEHGL